MWNLRTYKAICDTNIKPCPPPKIEAKITSQSQGEYPPKQDIVWYLYWRVSKFFASVRTPSPVPLSSCFHSISMTLLERCTGPTPEHLSNSTKVSQVSNTTGTPLHSILFHRCEAWSHRPPCQAPGLGSFRANAVPLQVDCRDSLVDFKCFRKGLWTKTMSN